jgi:hypothetical protein
MDLRLEFELALRVTGMYPKHELGIFSAWIILARSCGSLDYVAWILYWKLAGNLSLVIRVIILINISSFP